MTFLKAFLTIALFSAAGCATQPSAPPVSPPTAAANEAPQKAAALPPPEASAHVSPPLISDAVQNAVSAPDRSPEDQALDAQRKPAEMLAFFGIAPGMKIADLAAGGGYTSELVARTLGATGTLYGQNNKFILERFAAGPWGERLKKPAMKKTLRLDTEFDAPFPSSVKDLDAVLMVLFYHDTVWMKTNRAAMNQAIFSALKPGGIYGIVDHSARAGDADKVTQTLHRIEESLVISEIEAAGFQLAAQADFLRNPADQRDWNDSPMAAGAQRGKSDRFVLKFVKPLTATAVP